MDFFECISCGEKMPALAFDVVHVCAKGTLAPKRMPIGELNAIGSGTGKSSFIEPEFAEKIPMWKLGIMIHGYRLVQTCSACPEQYDVFDDLGQQVAYFRLRHGGFRVQVPDVGGDVVYTANPKGDGVFYEDERVKYLTEAILAVQEYYINRRWYKQEDFGV